MIKIAFCPRELSGARHDTVDDRAMRAVHGGANSCLAAVQRRYRLIFSLWGHYGSLPLRRTARLRMFLALCRPWGRNRPERPERVDSGSSAPHGEVCGLQPPQPSQSPLQHSRRVLLRLPTRNQL